VTGTNDRTKRIFHFPFSERARQRHAPSGRMVFAWFIHASI
jgi:hypothetical protein